MKNVGGLTIDPYDWANYRDMRTKGTAHHYIENHWADLKDGAVVDVQFILRETDAPKVSERVSSPLEN